MIRKLIPFLYFIAGLLYILFHYLNLDIPMLVVKTLLMPLLALYFIISINYSISRFRVMILFALLFSWGGDVLLDLIDINEQFFIFGLASFLVAQVCYSLAFLFPYPKHNVFTRNPLYIFPFLAYGFGILWFMFPDLGNMALPVTVYTVIILFMVMTTLIRKERVNKQSFQLIMVGAILFVLSDSIIAINKFSFPFEASRFLIMSLYITAQFLIIKGSIHQKMNN